MRLKRQMRVQWVVLAGMLAATTLSSRAAERVTLRNGFAMSCNHHAETEGRVRLYTTASDESYVEIAPEDIAGVELVPDPPAVPEKRVEAAPVAEVRLDGKLSESDLHEMLADAGQKHNVDVDLLASVVHAESGGNTHATSRAGARGLMQLMPATAADLGVQDSFKADENVRGGSTYLDALLTRYHDNLSMALAAYNAGPAAVDKYHGMPPYHETRVYVAGVIHEFNRRVRTRKAVERRAAAASGTATGLAARTGDSR